MKLYPATDTLARRIHNVAVGGVVVFVASAVKCEKGGK